MFKTYYLDPLILNTRLLFNCYEDREVFKFDFSNRISFQSVQGCVERGEDCEFVCKEFRFGTTSELFIGRLSSYYQFLRELEQMIEKVNKG